MKFASIHGFLFDLHGVLADSWRYHLDSWHDLANEMQIPWTATLEQTLPGMSRDDSLAVILASVHREAEFDEPQRHALTDHENALYQAHIQSMTPADLLPGIRALLGDLAAHGYKLALASASTNAPAELKRLQISQYFPHVVDPTTLKANKPAPDVYLAAAALIDEPISQCIGVEDTLTGLKAVKAAGCFAIGIGDATTLGPWADLVLPDTTALTLATLRRCLG